ncbi:MAG: leucine-rich repeat domain-containing protein [Ruminococcaceae bacterium]|nr:leucine-rich repeat domain-containing protein [Oscillospiraceae bacterium]
MNDKNIFDALRDIDPAWILDAAPQKRSSPLRTWAKWGAIAACFCLVVAAALGIVFWQRGTEDPNGGSPFHTHVFGEWRITREASCSEYGEQTRLCACGEKETQPIALLPHFAGAWVIEKEPTIKLPTPDDPTQREPGLKCQFCNRCGAKLDEELIPATGSLGLAYAINPDGKTFAVAGIGNCTDDEIIVPENFCGYHVTSVMKGAFNACEQLNSITLPETVTEIGEYAFRGSSLVSITLPEGLLVIGDTAFSDCDSLKEITIPASAKIGKRAFEGCYALRRVILSEGIQAIAPYTFQDCWLLESVSLPDSLRSIGEMAFYDCSQLKEIHIPPSVTSIGEHAFSFCGSLKSITLPKRLMRIEIGTFAYCYRLESVIIPSGVTQIRDGAFRECNKLLSVSIPDSVVVMGDYVFGNCSSLERITLPEGLTVIGENMFSGCGALQEVNIPDSVRRIGENAFEGCDKLIQTEGDIGYVGNWAVSCDRSASHVVLREGTVGLIDKLFYDYGKVAYVTVPRSVKYIGSRAFADISSLKEIFYQGTCEEWNAVEKGENWDQYSSWYSVVFEPEQTDQS